MKHVLVISNHNSSINFLDKQNLLESDHGNLNYDSCQYWDRTGGSRDTTPLDTEDGIRFHHFKDKFPVKNAGHFIGPEHLEYWVDQLAHRLDRRNRFTNPKETLDAVVIPEGAQEGNPMLDFLARLREQFPNIKVMVTHPRIHEASELPRDDVYLQAKGPDISTMFTNPEFTATSETPYVPVLANTERFHLNPQVDMALPNLDSRELTNVLLRHLVGAVQIQPGRAR